MPLRLMIACLSKHLRGLYKAAHLSSCEKPASMKYVPFSLSIPGREEERKEHRGVTTQQLTGKRRDALLSMYYVPTRCQKQGMQ